MLARRVLVALLVVVAVARVAATYRVFSQTFDEPIHIAAGFDWLGRGGNGVDAEHPPLSRAFFAIDSWARGAEPYEQERYALGAEILHRNNDYRRNLAGARAGNLPFLLLGMFVVFAWTKRLFGFATATLALALFTSLPPILAHAGLATTDMAAASTIAAALYALSLWLDEPTPKRAAILGVAIGLGLTAKFSFVAYFPAAALVLLIAKRPKKVVQLGLAAAIAALLVFALYLFQFHQLRWARLTAFAPGSASHQAATYAAAPGYAWVRADLIERYRHFSDLAASRGASGIDFVDWASAAGYPSPVAGRSGRDTMIGAPPLPPVPFTDRVKEPFRAAWQWIAMRVPLPAPLFFAGVETVGIHSAHGHRAFLFGERSMKGWWYYFPAVLFFKTPLAFLLLALLGTVLLARTQPAIAFAPPAMLLVAMTGHINIGVRHVLPLYPLLAIAAAYAAMWLWKRSRAAAVVLLGWCFVAAALAHPDYLAYFNEAAGRHPERIAVDSNLDWGQDVLRLRDFLRREPRAPLHVALFGTADWQRLGIDASELPPSTPVTGWIAISETKRALQDYAWLDGHPYRRIGKSIRLYRVARIRSD